MRSTVSLALGMLALFVVSVTGSFAQPIDNLTGTWVLIRLDGQAVPANITAPTLQVDSSGRISGSTGVNNYTTAANLESLSAGRIGLGPIATTKRAGPPEAMEYERRYLEALGNADTWRTSNGILILSDSGEEVLAYTRVRTDEREAPEITTVYGMWRLVRIEGEPVPAGLEPVTIGFGTSGDIIGYTGLNNYRTLADPSVLSTGAFAIGLVAMTFRAGPEPDMAFERRYLNALMRADAWSVSDDALVLTDGGVEVLAYERYRVSLANRQTVTPASAR